MARHFSESDIDEFRDCFHLQTKSGQIETVDELKTIMRSLSLNPTIQEVEAYFKEKGGRISFADFLDVMYTQSKKESIPQEILDAFRSWDVKKTGIIPVRDLKHILCDWGETLHPKEVDQLLRDANFTGPTVNYEQLLKLICAPPPDY